MLTYVTLALLLAAQLEPSYTIEDRPGGPVPCKATCKGEPMPPGFACGVVLNFDPPSAASVMGGEDDVIRGIELILDGTLYRAVYDPPLKRGNDFWRVIDEGIPARVHGDDLFVRWPGGKEARAKITHREKIDPNRPQRAFNVLRAPRLAILREL